MITVNPNVFIVLRYCGIYNGFREKNDFEFVFGNKEIN